MPIYNYNVTLGRTGCIGPNGSEIEMTRIAGRSFPGSTLAVNMATGRGGYIRVIPPSITQTIHLEDVLPSGGGSFLLGFRPAAIHDPQSETLTYTFTQRNPYSCIIPIF